MGVFGATWLMARFTGAELDEDLAWPDVLGIAMLSGVGFTVSLLIGELAYGVGTVTDEHVKIGVLVGSVVSALAASAAAAGPQQALSRHRERASGPTSDGDGVPDVFQG